MIMDDWRFIDTGACGVAYNMALDEAIATFVRKGISPPTLRFYGWTTPSVTIGYFQKIKNVDIEYCAQRNISVVRRLTGGRAVLHYDELTYSFSAKIGRGFFSKGLFDNYKKIGYALAYALSAIGLNPELKLKRKTSGIRNPLCFQSTSYGEITINNKKIIGSAQKQWEDCLLQQTSIPYSLNKEEICKVFRFEYGQILREQMLGLRDIFPELKTDDLKNAIRNSFEEIFGVRFIHASPSELEISLAKETEAQRYLSEQWNFNM